MRYLEDMETVRAEIPAELVVAAGLDADNLSAETTRLLALELYRGDRVPWTRRRTLPLADRAVHGVCRSAQRLPLHYGVDDLEEDRKTLERLGL